MSDELLRNPTHNGHLLVGALRRHKNRPVLFLGDTTLTGGQLAERVSQYIQAFEALGAGTGVTVGLLSLNRPEVLMILGASQTQGYRRTALHPLGSLDDHAYVLSDAGATALIIDPNPMFVERALGLLEKVDSLEKILTIGPVPEGLMDLNERAVDLSAEAAKYSPKPLVVADLPPDHIGGLTYTGGTTGKPKGVIGTTGNIATMTSIQLAEWEWPENPRFLMCTPLSHAGAAFFTPTLVKGGEMIVLGKFDPAEVLKVIEEQRITATMLVPSMLYALMDHPEERAKLEADPSLLPTAVEEMLRYVGTFIAFFRTATKDTELRGVPVQEGDRVAMFYPSANRDEAHFVDPDRFDVTRKPNPHLAFGGGGTHFCLGANLARVEAAALLSEVLSRMKNMELAGPIERMPSTLINGIHSMPVRFTPARRVGA